MLKVKEKYLRIKYRPAGILLNVNDMVSGVGGVGSSVCITSCYGLDGLGIEFRWGARFFCTCPDRPWDPPSLLYNGYRVFPGGKAAGVWC